METIITVRAKSDLKAIFDYIAADNKEEAVKFLDKLNSAIKKLSNYPDMGIYPKHKTLQAKGYRFIVVDPYLIFYRLGKIVYISAVIHGARSYIKLL